MAGRSELVAGPQQVLATEGVAFLQRLDAFDGLRACVGGIGEVVDL
jgi:hypothetical protein